MRPLLLLFLLAGATAASGQVGPDYQRPAALTTERFKNVSWRQPAPAAHLSKGEWWKIYRDPKLNELESRATARNQELKGALARFDQARTTARMSRSDLLPVIGLPLTAERQRTSENQPSPIPLNGLSYKGPAFNALADFSWEIDLWGKLRRIAESDEAQTRAAADAVHNVLLGIQAEVASTYFQIRALDSEIAIVRSAVGWRGEALRLARARVEAGTANDLEVAQSETEVATAEAEISVLQAQRDQLENALAILVGANPSSFALAGGGRNLPGPPKVPAGFPSELLERRPDVAAAEQQLAAATARIGAAQAEFFPSLTLLGTGGFQSGDIDVLFEPASLIYTYGPRLRVPVFSGGKNRFHLSRSHAQHDEALAAYRQAFLVAVGEVESSLSNLKNLANQANALSRASESAGRSSRLARTQYEAGSGVYLDVINANRAALLTEQAVARVAGQRLVASVALVKALGGGWDQTRRLEFPEVSPDPAARSNPEETETPLLKKLFRKPVAEPTRAVPVADVRKR